MMSATSSTTIPVYVVVPPRVLLLDIAGPVEVLRKANFIQNTLRFAIAYVGPSPTIGSSIGLAVTGVDPLPEHLPEGALVIMSGSTDDLIGNASVQRNADALIEAEIVDWLKRTIRPGIRLASICSGALLAARAGLLDGHECTTHHAITAELSRLAPAAHVRENRLFVEDRERLTSARNHRRRRSDVAHRGASGRACLRASRRTISRRLSPARRRRPAALAMAGRPQPYSPRDTSRTGRGCRRSHAGLVGQRSRPCGRRQFAQSFAAFQRACRHERDRICESNARGAGTRSAGGIASRHGSRSRTSGIHLGTAIPACLGSPARTAAKPDSE